MKRSKGYIGVFDSGFGGLSVLKEIKKIMPGYTYIYLGDSARAPYGGRSAEEVDRFTFEAMEFLYSLGCELVVVACNTASAEALRQVQQEYLPKRYPTRKALGVIVPAVEEAIERGGKRIGVLATLRTVSSGTFPREAKKRGEGVTVFQNAAPLLVPLVEEGEHKGEAGRRLVQEYLKPLLARRIDTLILGCTHYGHLESTVRRLLPKHVRIVSGGKIVARKLKAYFVRHSDLQKRLTKSGRIHFYTTDSSERFKRLGSEFYGAPLRVHSVTLPTLPARLTQKE